MARVQSNNDAILGKIIAEANGAITAGDLIIHNEPGNISSAVSGSGLGVMNNTTAGATETLTYTNSRLIASGSNYGPSAYNDNLQPMSTVLANGNIAFVYSGNGSTYTSTVRLFVMTPAGALVVNNKQISSDTGINTLQVLDAGDSKICIVWSKNDQRVEYELVSYDGVTTHTNDATITTDCQPAIGTTWNALIHDGDLLLLYNRYDSGTGYPPALKRVDLGTGTVTTINDTIQTTSNPFYMGLRSDPNTGGYVAFWGASSKSKYYYQRYSSSDVAGSIIQGGTYSGSGGAPELYYAVSNAGIVSMPSRDSGATRWGVTIFNSSDTNTYTSPTDTNYTIDYLVPTSIPAGDGIAVIHNNGSRWYLDSIDSTGAFTGSRDWTGPANFTSGTSTGTWGVWAKHVGGGFYSIWHSIPTGSGASYRNIQTYLVNVGADASVSAVVGSLSTIQSNTNQISNETASFLSDGSVFYSVLVALSRPYTGAFKCLRRSIIGVALESVTNGQPCAVATKGSFNINGTFIGGSFNNKSNAVLGCQAVLGSGTISMQGIE